MGLFVINIAWPSGGFVALICCHCGGFVVALRWFAVVYGGIAMVFFFLFFFPVVLLCLFLVVEKSEFEFLIEI